MGTSVAHPGIAAKGRSAQCSTARIERWPSLGLRSGVGKTTSVIGVTKQKRSPEGDPLSLVLLVECPDQDSNLEPTD